VSLHAMGGPELGIASPRLLSAVDLVHTLWYHVNKDHSIFLAPRRKKKNEGRIGTSILKWKRSSMKGEGNERGRKLG
jgi:hypothetical protein